MRSAYEREKYRLFGSFLSTLLLPQWTVAESMKALQDTQLEAHARRIFGGRRYVRVRFQENSAALQLSRVKCSAAQPGWSIEQQVLDAAFWRSIFAGWKVMCAEAWRQWIRKCYLWQVPRSLSDCNCWRGSALFWVSRSSALFCLHCNGEARTGKNASNGASHDSGILRICWEWPSTAHRARWEGIFLLPFHTHFYSDSCIS